MAPPMDWHAMAAMQYQRGVSKQVTQDRAEPGADRAEGELRCAVEPEGVVLNVPALQLRAVVDYEVHAPAHLKDVLRPKITAREITARVPRPFRLHAMSHADQCSHLDDDDCSQLEDSWSWETASTASRTTEESASRQPVRLQAHRRRSWQKTRQISKE